MTMQLVVDNLVKKDYLPWNGILLLVTVQNFFIAPPRIVLFQNSSKFLALHHFDIGTNIEYVSKSTDFAYTTFLNNINWH